MNSFAWFRQQCLKPHWVILVAGGYGAFMFQGTEAQAEEMRAHKSAWEGAIAWKRPASYRDAVQPSGCWNHRGFLRQCRYGSRRQLLKRPYVPRFHCDCGECAT